MIRYIDLIEDTICAPVTAQGLAGVSIVRVSGPEALSTVRKLCSFLPDQLESHKIYFGHLAAAETSEPIDQVLVSYFAKGKSFTGDEVLEISSHGSPVIVNKIMNELFSLQCRQAERGEFSFRAFYNGKIDLVQAESIQSFINSQNTDTGRWTLQQLSGRLSEIYEKLEKDLLLVIGHLEASIDFVEQDIDPSAAKDLLPSITMLRAQIDQLAKSYDVNKNLVQGFKVLLVGETNAGKSSLYNCFFEQDKAIVAEVAGTTRDLISENCYFGSLPVRLTDTAGLRDSQDPVERIGMAKARAEIDQADVLLWVIDSTEDIPQNLLHEFPQEKTFYVFNKSDLHSEGRHPSGEVRAAAGEGPIDPSGFALRMTAPLKMTSERCFFVSAKLNQGIEELKSVIVDFLTPKNESGHKEVVTQSRHYEHLCQASALLEKSENMIIESESPDIVSQELQQALFEIHSILGRTFDDEILDTIFSEFCLGK